MVGPTCSNSPGEIWASRGSNCRRLKVYHGAPSYLRRISDTPLLRKQGVLPSPMRLAPSSRNESVEARMSRSVHEYCYPSVPECPPVPAREKKLSMLELRSKRPLGVYGALLRDATPLQSSVLWLTRSCFYPKERFTLEPANMIQLSKYCREYRTLTDTCQGNILKAWKRNRKTPRCGSPRKICKRLHVFESCMGVSQMWRQFAWLYKLWQGKSRPPTHHAPKGRAIHPSLERRGLSGPLTVRKAGGICDDLGRQAGYAFI